MWFTDVLSQFVAYLFICFCRAEGVFCFVFLILMRSSLSVFLLINFALAVNSRVVLNLVIK